MVGVAQQVELRVVIPAVVGSSPIVHPNVGCWRAGPHKHQTSERMQVSTEVISELERRLIVTLPGEEIDDMVTQRLRDVSRKAHLRGFRPGKAPLKEVRRRFGEATRLEVTREVMPRFYQQAVAEAALAPVSRPAIEIVRSEPGCDLVFEASFEVAPEFDLTDITDLKLTDLQIDIADADIDEMVEKLRAQQTDWRSVERPAQEGDRVNVSFSGKIDGQAAPGTEHEAFAFVIGDGQVMPELNLAVTGLAAGDSTAFSARFPDDHPAEVLRAQTVDFELTLGDAAEPVLPDLDEAFLEAYGVVEGGMPAFRAQVASNMDREIGDRLIAWRHEHVSSALRACHDFPIPASRVQEQAAGMVNSLGGPKAAAEQGQPLLDEITRQARIKVAEWLIFERIIEQFRLQADDASIRAEVERMAEGYTDSAGFARAIYHDEARLRAVEQSVLLHKVLDLVLEQAQVERQTVTYADFTAGRMPAPEVEASEPEVADAAGDADPGAGEADESTTGETSRE